MLSSGPSLNFKFIDYCGRRTFMVYTPFLVNTLVLNHTLYKIANLVILQLIHFTVLNWFNKILADLHILFGNINAQSHKISTCRKSTEHTDSQ